MGSPRGLRTKARYSSRLAWPASLGKNHAPLIRGTAKRASEFKGLIALRPGRHLTRKFQRIGGCDVVVQPVSFE
jgi:hypothetical protein